MKEVIHEVSIVNWYGEISVLEHIFGGRHISFGVKFTDISEAEAWVTKQNSDTVKNSCPPNQTHVIYKIIPIEEYEARFAGANPYGRNRR